MTATTPTRCRCGPPSTTWPRPPRAAASPSSGRWPSSARRRRATTPRSADGRRRPGSTCSWRWGTRRGRTSTRSRGPSVTAWRAPRRRARCSSGSPGRATACSSRARARRDSSAWSATGGDRARGRAGRAEGAGLGADARRGPHRRHGVAPAVHVPGAAVHRVPARAGVRSAHPRGGARGPRRKGGHADHGRAPDLPRGVGAVPDPRPVRRRQPRRLRHRGGERDARVPRRLVEDLEEALARPVGAVEARGPGGDRARAVVGRHALRRPDRHAQHAPVRRHGRSRDPLSGADLPRPRGLDERRQPDRRPRRARGGLRRDRAIRLHGDDLPHERAGGSRPPVRVHGLPVVQLIPRVGLHGRHRSARLGRRDSGARRGHQDRDPARDHRRHLRRRGAVGGGPGVRLPALPQARVPDGAGPPPLRAARVVGDQDHPALLDRRGDLLGDRLHALPAVGGMRDRPPLPPGPYLVVGLARSGAAAARALLAHGEVMGCDVGRPAEAEALAAAGADVRLESDGLELLPRARTVVKSPGVPAAAPAIAAARAQGLEVVGELELAWRMLPNEFVAVTGTNGKTTTVELVAAIHRAARLPVAVAGNVGTALASLVGPDGPGPEATVVCEASSFQLDDAVAFAPETAVLLNLTEDHIDRHGSFAAYRDAKLRVFAHQRLRDVAVLPHGFAAPPGEARVVSFGPAEAADLACAGGTLRWEGADLVPAEEIRLRGAHNLSNAMAASAAALARGTDPDAVRAALRTFAGVPHRLEEVAERDGVLFVNDSKATNPDSARVGIEAFPGGVHAILGGSRKGGRFRSLRQPVAERCRAAYLVGDAAEQLAADLEGTAPVVRCGMLADAVERAAAAARPGEVVLLSPACASFDAFASFEHRGAAFRELARRLPGAEAPAPTG